MANLGIFEIDTDGEYVDLETATSLTLEVGTKYTLQVQNKLGYLTVCTLNTTPNEGGIVLKDLEKFSYTPIESVDCYLKTPKGGSVLLNIMS